MGTEGSESSWETPEADDAEDFWELEPLPGLDADNAPDDLEAVPDHLPLPRPKARPPGRQSLEERYGTGRVQTAGPARRTGGAAAGRRVSAHDKDRLWREVQDATEKASDGRLRIPRHNVCEWIRDELLQHLALDHADGRVRQFVRTMEKAQDVLGRWLAPRTKDGQCKRAPQEARAFLEAGCAASLAALYTYKLRRSELLWSRYLPSELQRKLVQRRPGVNPTVREQVLEIFRRFSLCEEGKAILYILAPRRSRRWYVGMTKANRKRGTADAPGAEVRGLEHLAALFTPNRGGPGAKYKAWKQLGAGAVCMVPVTYRDLAEIESLEAFVIARDQPTANRRGRRVERRQLWETRQRNALKGPRPPRWQREPMQATSSCALNFWEQPLLVAKAVSNQWKAPAPPQEGDGQPGEAVGPDPIGETYKKAYRDRQEVTKMVGPVDIYNPEEKTLLANYISTGSTWEVAVHSEKLSTARLMELYMMASQGQSDSKRKSGRTCGCALVASCASAVYGMPGSST